MSERIKFAMLRTSARPLFSVCIIWTSECHAPLSKSIDKLNCKGWKGKHILWNKNTNCDFDFQLIDCFFNIPIQVYLQNIYAFELTVLTVWFLFVVQLVLFFEGKTLIFRIEKDYEGKDKKKNSKKKYLKNYLILVLRQIFWGFECNVHGIVYCRFSTIFAA